MITHQDLMRFAPRATATIADAIVTKADTVLPKWGINTAPRLWMFMAMADVESAHFTALFEGMSYSAEGLMKTWPNRFPSADVADAYARQPQKIANKVYGGRMGNVGPDDGWLGRGQGLMQTTGMDSFTRLAKALGVTVDQCRAMLTASDTLLECAAATFVAWGCLPYADRGDVEGCTRVINGGLNGLADRQAAYALAKKVWPTIPAASSPTTIATTFAPPHIVPKPAPKRPNVKVAGGGVVVSAGTGAVVAAAHGHWVAWPIFAAGAVIAAALFAYLHFRK